MPSVSYVEGLLQVTELQLVNSSGKDSTALVLCDIAYSNCWVSNSIASRLDLQGTDKGIKTEEVIDTKLVALTVKPPDNQAFEPFKVSPYVKENFDVGAAVINLMHFKKHNRT